MQTAGDRGNLLSNQTNHKEIFGAAPSLWLISPGDDNLQQPPANWWGKKNFPLVTTGCQCSPSLGLCD